MAEWVRSTSNLRLVTHRGGGVARRRRLAGDRELGRDRREPHVPGRGAALAFNPAREDTGSGAWELAARVDGFRVDEDVFDQGFANPATQAQEALEWGVGVNWYINPFLKLSLDYNDTRFDGGAPDGGDRPTEGVLGTRFQVAF